MDAAILDEKIHARSASVAGDHAFRPPGHTLPAPSTPGGPQRARLRVALSYMGCVDALDLAASRIVWLDELDRVTIGSADGWIEARQGTSIRIGIPDRQASSQHAVLERTGGRWRLRDSDSKNGTFVQGRRVVEHRLGGGDIFETGHSFWRYVEFRPLQPSVFSGEPAHIGSTRTISPVLIEALTVLQRFAGGDGHLLVIGDTGTGKEILTDQIHAWSGRKGKCHKVNCANLNRERAEAELLGWEKGAFTGALRDTPGHIEAAHGGTLMLDEVGELPPDVQPKLLRVVEDGVVTRLGATSERNVDVRIVSATNRPIPDMVRAGTFREDLYARLAKHITHLPPLRERPEDLLTLIAQILRAHPDRNVRLHPRAARRLLAHDWPLNVRELQSAIEGAVLVADDVLLADHFDVGAHPPASSDSPPTSPTEPGPERRTKATIESTAEAATRAHYEQLLARHQGDVSAIAREQGIHRNQVYRILRRTRLKPEAYRERAKDE